MDDPILEKRLKNMFESRAGELPDESVRKARIRRNVYEKIEREGNYMKKGFMKKAVAAVAAICVFGSMTAFAIGKIAGITSRTDIRDEVHTYEQALELLPMRWQQAARRLPDWRKAQAEEFRLRTGRPMTVLTCEGEILVSDELPRALVTQSDLEQMCDMVTGYSRYAVSETLSKGYLIGRGGFRVGVCGTAVLREGANTNLRDISSVAVRISRQVRGLAEPLLRELWEPEGFPSTLLLAPPGVGKTTLLRDMICALSDGDEQRPACRVGIVDERGELAAMYRGMPQLEVGAHTDVLDGCPKALGITMLLRSANPQVIAVDEITAEEDLRAMLSAAHCGVALLATIHAANREELARKPLFARLLEMRVFQRMVTITVEDGRRVYRVEAL